MTTRGFADVIEIARQARPSLYDVWRDRPEPLVPRARRLEVGGRLDAHGRELEPVREDDIPAIPDDVDAVAVCLLHSDLDPAHEQAVARVLRDRGLDVTCSHEVSPEFREYERTVTTVANARLRPLCGDYLTALAPLADDVLVMTSAGGLVPVVDAAARPASLLLSGPAGGVRAAAAVAEACGFADAVSFDMGGTSTDVCLIRGGIPEPAPSLLVAGYPIRLPALAVHTIGAGGGSIARLDPGGALVVGPESAGAEPGPAAYGRGGTEPTVTDADLVAGRIPPAAAFPGLGQLDVDAARATRSTCAGVTATGVLAVVDAAMEEAVRAVTVARGVDPRDLALVAFGGAGPLHACAIADALDMRAVLVPPRAGVLSAVGLVASPRRRELVRSWSGDAAAGAIASRADAARSRGRRARRTELARSRRRSTVAMSARATSSPCRPSRSSTPSTPAATATRSPTPRSKWSRCGRAPRALPRWRSPTSPRRSATTVRGPAVVSETDCTVYVPAGWRADVGPLGTWILRRPSGGTG